MQTFSNEFYTIEYPDDIAYSDNKYIIRVRRVSSAVAYINLPDLGATYRVFDSQFFTIELSDYARANSPGGVTIDIVALNSSMQELFTFTVITLLYKGFYSNAVTWPLKKYTVCGEDESQPVQIHTPYDLQLQQYNSGTWTPINSIFANSWADIELPVGDYRLVPLSGTAETYEFSIVVTEGDCKYANSIPVVWLSENGYSKKWIFEITNQIRQTINSSEIETYSDGYDIRKDKQVQLQVIERQADINARIYLSDIVYSSDLFTYYYIPGRSDEVEVPITVSDGSTNVDITNTYSDFTLTLNVARHDNL